MRVLEINENIRKLIAEEQENIEYPEDFLESIYSVQELIEIYDLIKQNSALSKYIAGVLLSTSYVTNYNIYDNFLDNETKYILGYYESFSSISEFIEKMNYKDFNILCSDTLYFEDLKGAFKRTFIEKSLVKKDYLFSIFPCFLLDVMGYLNVYGTEEIMMDYYNKLPYYKDKDATISDTTKFGTRFLMELEENNFSNYCMVLLELLQIYYKYNTYLKDNNKESDNLVNTLLVEIESSLESLVYYSVNNNYILESIVKNYIDYNLVSDDEKQKIEKYYEEPVKKKKLAKVVKECDRIKGQ